MEFPPLFGDYGVYILIVLVLIPFLIHNWKPSRPLLATATMFGLEASRNGATGRYRNHEIVVSDLPGAPFRVNVTPHDRLKVVMHLQRKGAKESWLPFRSGGPIPIIGTGARRISQTTPSIDQAFNVWCSDPEFLAHLFEENTDLANRLVDARVQAFFVCPRCKRSHTDDLIVGCETREYLMTTHTDSTKADRVRQLVDLTVDLTDAIERM